MSFLLQIGASTDKPETVVSYVANCGPIDESYFLAIKTHFSLFYKEYFVHEPRKKFSP